MTDGTLIVAVGIDRKTSSGLRPTALIRAQAGLLVAFLPMRCLADRAAIKRDLETRARIERRILEAAEAALPGGSVSADGERSWSGGVELVTQDCLWPAFQWPA